MLGSGPDDGDIIEMSAGKPRLTGVIGGGRRLVLVVGVCALLVAGAALAAVRLNSGPPANAALAKLITEVTTVPVRETVPAPSPTGIRVRVALGSGVLAPPLPPDLSGSASALALAIAPSVPVPVSGPPLTADGKPEVLYVAKGYCPYCLAEIWALIVALSRFGQFSGLSTSRSPLFDDVPPVDGWTFYGSSYSSTYLTFVPVETASNVLVSPKSDPAKAASYRRLQRLTPGEQAVFATLDPAGSTPFLDFGGKAAQAGTEIVPSMLAGLTWSEIAADLRLPQTAVGMTILASVDTLTAEFCRLTGDRPAAVCSG